MKTGKADIQEEQFMKPGAGGIIEKRDQGHDTNIV